MRRSDTRAALSSAVRKAAVAMRAGLAGGLSLALFALPVAAECLRGANVAGGEFGDLPGQYAHSYIYPSRATFDYLRRKGMNVARLPFRWERLQPELNAPLEEEEFQRLDRAVSEASHLGLTVILDPHNYAKYREEMIGSDGVPVSAFADFWARLAARYAGREDVVFLLMNEPANITAADWLPAVNAALAAIRDSGADNLVMVPGTIWTGASHWFDPQDGGSNAEVLRKVVDPQGRFVFDVHQYLDADFSGTNAGCERAEDAVVALERLTGWLEDTGNAAFLGEFGGHASVECYKGLIKMASLVNSRPDVWAGWAYWAAGDWWGDYPLSIQPGEDGADRPQMVAIEGLIERRSAGEQVCTALSRRNGEGER